MDNERVGRRILDEGEAIWRGQLLEFTAKQEKRGLRKDNAAITQAKTALSQTKIRALRPTSSKGQHKS